jgi:DNA-binding transcriptional LysR family regulator
VQDWDDYRIFLEMARSNSIREAADRLDVSHSTALRRLDRLEENLGAKLFDRHNSGYTLTLAGEEVLSGVLKAEENLEFIDRAVAGRDAQLSGTVTVSVPDLIVHGVVLPHLKEFRENYPDIQLKLDLTYDLANLHKREADIAVRFTQKPDPDLVGRKICAFAAAPYASRSYLEHHDPFDPQSNARWIAWGHPETWQGGESFPHLKPMGYFDNVMLQVNCTVEGIGVGMLPCILADRYPALVRLKEPELYTDIWVLYHSDLRSNARVRAVKDFLMDIMHEHSAELRAIEFEGDPEIAVS